MLSVVAAVLNATFAGVYLKFAHVSTSRRRASPLATRAPSQDGIYLRTLAFHLMFFFTQLFFYGTPFVLQEIHNMLKENNKVLKCSNASPDWRGYVDFVNNVVVDGLSRVICASLEYLLEQVHELLE